jgi:hypothetical protein
LWRATRLANDMVEDVAICLLPIGSRRDFL